MKKWYNENRKKMVFSKEIKAYISEKIRYLKEDYDKLEENEQHVLDSILRRGINLIFNITEKAVYCLT